MLVSLEEVGRGDESSARCFGYTRASQESSFHRAGDHVKFTPSLSSHIQFMNRDNYLDALQLFNVVHLMVLEQVPRLLHV